MIVTGTPSLRLLVNIEPGSCERVRGRLKVTVADLNFTGWSRMMMLRLPLPRVTHWQASRTGRLLQARSHWHPIP